MQEWLDSHAEEVSARECRVFIKRVRALLAEKGIPLGQGNQNFQELANSDKETPTAIVTRIVLLEERCRRVRRW